MQQLKNISREQDLNLVMNKQGVMIELLNYYTFVFFWKAFIQ